MKTLGKYLKKPAVVTLICLLFSASGTKDVRTAIAASDSVMIAEIQSEGTTANDEYIRLFNASDSPIDLAKYTLKKKTKSGTLSSLVSSAKFSGTIPARGYFIITHPGASDTYSADLVYSGSSYYISDNNTVLLYDDKSTLLDKVGYGEASDFETAAAPQPSASRPIARKPSGTTLQDTDNNAVDFELPAEAEGDDSNDDSNDDSSKPEPTGVFLNELLPNPSGTDTGKEYIELHNAGTETADISGWTVRDSSKTGKYEFPSGTTIPAQGFLAIYHSAFKFSLNNSLETVTLSDTSGDSVSTTTYKDAQDNASWSFDGADWHWSSHATPDDGNIFDKPLTGTMKMQKMAYRNEKISFTSNAKSGKGKKSRYTWDFGDGHKSYKKSTTHTYDKNGTYLVTFAFSDGTNRIEKTKKIKITSYPKQSVRITRISPNPKGRDTDNEWIEITNFSKKKVNLAKWGVATGTKKPVNRVISKKIVMMPGKTVRLTRKDALFALPNTTGKIELRYPTGKAADKVKYQSVGTKTIRDDVEFVRNGKAMVIRPTQPDIIPSPSAASTPLQ